MLVETYLGRVSPLECDHLGHMNVQFYVAKVSDAAWHVMASIGITPGFIRERRQAPAAVKQEIFYLKEARPATCCAWKAACSKPANARSPSITG